jgi:short-subunit dehydrogenase involved in D-alanine esterification of teichoic acids
MKKTKKIIGLLIAVPSVIITGGAFIGRAMWRKRNEQNNDLNTMVRRAEDDIEQIAELLPGNGRTEVSEEEYRRIMTQVESAKERLSEVEVLLNEKMEKKSDAESEIVVG